MLNEIGRGAGVGAEMDRQRVVGETGRRGQAGIGIRDRDAAGATDRNEARAVRTVDHGFGRRGVGRGGDCRGCLHLRDFQRHVAVAGDRCGENIGLLRQQQIGVGSQPGVMCAIDKGEGPKLLSKPAYSPLLTRA